MYCVVCKTATFLLAFTSCYYFHINKPRTRLSVDSSKEAKFVSQRWNTLSLKVT